MVQILILKFIDMKTIVRNVLTSEEYFFCNDLSLIDNMVSAIIYIEKKTSNLLNESTRKKIISDNTLIEHTSKITGRSFVYCEKHDLIAHTEK